MGQRPGEAVSRADAAAADDPDATPETAALRGDIEQTRTEMSGTIDAIQDRLDPEVLSEQAKDTAQEVADRAIAQAKEAVQEVADRAIPQAKEAVQEVADRTIPQAKEAVQEVADRTIPQAKEAIREVTDHAIAQTKEAIREVTAQTGAALRGATIGKVEDMARYAGDTAGGWRHTLVATVKAHPLPATLAGLTLGYLFLNRESGPPAWEPRRGGALDDRGPGHRAEGYSAYGGYRAGAYRPGAGGASRDEPSVSERAGAMAGQAQQTAGHIADQAQDRVGQVVDKVQETAGQMTGQVQETAGQMTGQVQETAGEVVDQMQEQAHRAQSFLGRQLEENPLAVGAVAVVLGSALGAAMGTTPREDRFFGEARDRLMGRAQEATQETLEKVGRVADEVKGTVERATDEVKSTAQSEARAQALLPRDAKDAGSTGSGSTGSRATGATGSRSS